MGTKCCNNCGQRKTDGLGSWCELNILDREDYDAPKPYWDFKADYCSKWEEKEEKWGLWDFVKIRGLRICGGAEIDPQVDEIVATVQNRIKESLEKAVEEIITKIKTVYSSMPGEEVKKTVTTIVHSDIFAHHYDYNFPYRVVFLCQKCHGKAHRGTRGTKLRGNIYSGKK